jgi:hypothetical protein
MNLRKGITACAACMLGRKITVEDKKWDPCYDGLTLHDLRCSAVRSGCSCEHGERDSLDGEKMVQKPFTQYA